MLHALKMLLTVLWGTFKVVDHSGFEITQSLKRSGYKSDPRWVKRWKRANAPSQRPANVFTRYSRK